MEVPQIQEVQPYGLNPQPVTLRAKEMGRNKEKPCSK